MEYPQLGNVGHGDVNLAHQIINGRDIVLRGADHQRIGAFIGHSDNARRRCIWITGCCACVVSSAATAKTTGATTAKAARSTGTAKTTRTAAAEKAVEELVAAIVIVLLRRLKQLFHRVSQFF